MTNSAKNNVDEIIDKIWEWFETKHMNDPIPQLNKVIEEVGELAHCVNRREYYSPEIIDALGDSFITLIGMCHALGADPRVCMIEAYDEIKDRTGHVNNGNFIKDE